MDRHRTWKLLLLTGMLAGWVAGTQAQESFPSKPIRLIVAFAPGGSGDLFGRLVGQHISQGHRHRLEAAVVMIEQRAGQHVGARDRELEIAAGHGGCALAVREQIE